MKWFKHLVFLVFFVIVFSFVEIHEKRREVLLEKNSKVSYVVAYPRILRTICLFLFGVGVILFLYLSIMNIKYHGELEKGLFVFASFFILSSVFSKLYIVSPKQKGCDVTHSPRLLNK